MPAKKRNKALTLSLIIPAYNEENYILACLETVAAQSVMPDEVLLIDNNCTDPTVRIASEFPFIRVIKEEKQGITPARDAGFNTAKGDIIARIDADSQLPSNWVEYVKNFFETYPYDKVALTGGGYFYNIRSPRLNGWILSQFAYRLNRLIIGHYILWGSNMAIPRALWRDTKSHVCKRADIHEDMDLAIHAHRAGYSIVYVPSLRVGAMLKRMYSDRSKLNEHMARWPLTLRTHGYHLWWMGSLGNVLLRFVAGPIAFLVEYFNRYVLRRKRLSL